MNRVRNLKFLLWIATGLAAAVAVSRFLYGLGATTNLSDSTPWGLWIGFDVMSGVALAAGGFIVTATVYIFRLERYHHAVRPAVLTAWLGYIAVAVGLLFDLGLPWNIWHMIVFWNPHSPLFEVGWCVMLYLTVLTMEFFPVPAESFTALAKVRRLLLRARLPLVITGIGLSTLHQSSLGSLFLIMPYHLHALWYSPILPLLFLISAIALGLQMVTFENLFTGWLYRRRPETEMVAGLCGAARWVLYAYLAVRFTDLFVRGQAGALAGGGWQTGLFWIEILVMGAVPAALLSFSRVRRTPAGQFTAATLGITGVVLNRVDVGGLAHLGRGTYIPSWTEVAISAGVVAAAALAFLFILEHFNVWDRPPVNPEADSLRLPHLNNVGATWLGTPAIAGRTVYSLGFIFAAAVGFALLSPQPAATRGLESSPVAKARGAEVLWIDGNRDGFGVAFRHEDHINRLGGKQACARCHHMNLPRDRNTGCYQCHQDMYAPTDAFRHDWHASPAGGKLGCVECHPAGQVREAATARKCDRCHKDLLPAGATVALRRYEAPGYADAAHQLCTGCHAERVKQGAKPEMARCAWCHRDRRDFVDAGGFAFRDPRLAGKRLVLPPR